MVASVDIVAGRALPAGDHSVLVGLAVLLVALGLAVAVAGSVGVVDILVVLIGLAVIGLVVLCLLYTSDAADD